MLLCHPWDGLYLVIFNGDATASMSLAMPLVSFEHA